MTSVVPQTNFSKLIEEGVRLPCALICIADTFIVRKINQAVSLVQTHAMLEINIGQVCLYTEQQKKSIFCIFSKVYTLGFKYSSDDM